MNSRNTLFFCEKLALDTRPAAATTKLPAATSSRAVASVAVEREN